MIKSFLSDFSQVILFPKDVSYVGSLNELFKESFGKKTSNFFDLYFLNEELLTFYKKLKQRHNLQMCIYTAGTVQNRPELKSYLTPVFDKIFSSVETSYEKNDSAGYLYLAEQLKLKPEEILFLDDSSKNIVAAKEVGVQAIQYHDNEQAQLDIERCF